MSTSISPTILFTFWLAREWWSHLFSYIGTRQQLKWQPNLSRSCLFYSSTEFFKLHNELIISMVLYSRNETWFDNRFDNLWLIVSRQECLDFNLLLKYYVQYAWFVCKEHLLKERCDFWCHKNDIWVYIAHRMCNSMIFSLHTCIYTSYWNLLHASSMSTTGTFCT